MNYRCQPTVDCQWRLDNGCSRSNYRRPPRPSKLNKLRIAGNISSNSQPPGSSRLRRRPSRHQARSSSSRQSRRRRRRDLFLARGRFQLKLGRRLDTDRRGAIGRLNQAPRYASRPRHVGEHVSPAGRSLDVILQRLRRDGASARHQDSMRRRRRQRRKGNRRLIPCS